VIADLFFRFVLISLLAFGGGGAALPLVERLAVSETGWVSPQDFAAAAAQQLQRFVQHPRLAGFGRGAAPAVVGLLGVTALSIAKQSFTHWGYAVIALIALVLALWTKVHPILILMGGAALGWGIGVVTTLTTS
jgi:chromate transport protein ChrA